MVSVSNITRLLPENSANNTSVFLEINDPLIPLADVNVVLEGNFDLDGDGINTFTDPIFNFAQQAWEIRVADRDLIDFEALDSFSLTVRASDGTSRDSGTLNIPLSDVNEAPILDDATFQALDATTIEAGLISSVTASDPENNSLSYEIIGGNDPDANGRGAFRLDRGAVTLVNPEELTQEYNLTVAVSDPAGLQDTATVTIPVFAAPFVESRELTLDENSAEGTVISLGSDLIQDANTNLADLRVTLTSGNQDSDGDGNFAFSSPIFNPDTEAWELIVNDTDELNFEENESFALELQASDGTRADVGFPTIALNDLNEAPVIRDQTFNELNGNNASEFQFVGNVDAFDPDSGQEPPNLAITGGNDPDGNDINAFRVEDGQIQVANPGELSQDFTLTITATDTEDSNLTDSAEITIPITAAPIVASNTIELPENSENDTAIALDIRDANTPLGELNVTLNSGNPDNDDDGIKAFSAPTFNEEAGQWELLVTDSDELNFEEDNSFPLQIQASDGEQSDTRFPTIALTDVNEAPELAVPEFEQPIDANEIVEEFEQAQAQAEAAEEEIELPVVGAITEIEDPDFDQSVSTLAITGGNDPDGNEINAFIINELNELVVINPQELTQDFTLSITATDDSEDALTSTNELIVPVFAAPIVEDNTVQFLDRENAEGEEETVIPLEISDLDDPIADLSVTLNGGNQDNDADGEFAFSNPSFNPDTGEWEILVNDSDDLTFDRVNLEIQASDGENSGIGFTEVTLAPDVTSETIEIEENSPEETAIPLEIEDSDTPLNELDVTLINGNQDIDGDGRSAFNQPEFNEEAGQWEVTVNDSDDLNFEVNDRFFLEIEASDGERSDRGTSNIVLEDVNEAPVFENISKLLSTVDIDGEFNDDGNGAIVGQITGFTDPDGDVSDPEGQDFRFSINEVGGFNLDSATITATGEIFIGDRAQLGDNLEFEVTVIDSEGAESEPILIGIPADTAENDAPIILDTQLETIDLDRASEDDLVGTVPNIDPDGDSINFSIDSGNDPDGNGANAFAINENGEITVFDPDELTGNFTLTVTATDINNDSLTDTAEVTIPVSTAPVVASNTIELPENSGNGTVIPLSVEDIDTPLNELVVTLNSGNQDNDQDGVNAFNSPQFNSTEQRWEITLTDSDEFNLDFESLGDPSNFRTLQIQASDGERADIGSPTIAIADVNEAPIAEDVAFPQVDQRFIQAGDLVGTLSVSDPEGDDVNLAITDGNDPDGNGTDAFAIDNSGRVTIADPNEITDDFFLEVTVTDTVDNNLTDTVQVTIPVNPVPVVNGDFITIDENVADEPIPLDITDDDTTDATLDVTLIDGNQDIDQDGEFAFSDPQFNNQTNQWEITVNDRNDLDFETQNSFSLQVRASDGVGVDTGTYTINLNDVNERPEVEAATFGINTTTAQNGTFVGTISVSEPDDNQGIDSLQIGDGNDPDDNGANAFEISGFELRVANPEELVKIAPGENFTLTVVATDTSGEVNAASITVETFSVPAIEDNTLKLLEDSDEGSTVSLNIQDQDTPLEDLNVTLNGGNQDIDQDGEFAFGEPTFNSEFGQWEIPVNDTDDLDFETYNNFDLDVQVSDGTNSATGFPEISLTDVNEAPILEAQTFDLDFNAIAQEFEQNQENAEEEEEIVLPVVGTIEVEEPDLGQNVSLAITGGNDPDGNDRNAFTITENNFGELELQVQNPEELTQDFTLQVTATDDSDDALTTTTDLTIELTAIPTFDADDPIPLPENSPEGTVIPLDIQDANTPLEELTVTLEDGNQDNDGDGNFVFSNPSFNQETGQWELTVTDSDELDFEATDSFDLEIEVRDQENGTTASPTIAVEDINEAPQVEAQTIEVNANTAFQLQPLDRIETSVPDFGQSVETLAVTGGNDPDGNEVNAFIINESNRLTVLNPDELTQDFTLTITATDDSAEQVTGTGEINVSVTAAPIVTNDPIPLPENSPEGTVIPLNINDLNTPNGDLTVNLNEGNQDLDGDGIFAFSNPSFNTDAGQWELTVTDPDELDFESENNRFPLELQASDGEQANSSSPEIVLTDVNEAPVGNDITLPLLNTATIEAEEVIGNASITDPEDDSLEFTINSGDDNGAFTIDEAGDISIVDPSLISAPFQLEISATETETDEQNATTAVVTVPVDTPPAFVETEFTVPENSAIDFEVGQVVINEDEGLESLSLDSANFDGDENPALRIDEQGNVFVNDADDIDFEANSGLLLGELTATNVNGLTQSAILTVNVQDVNEIPTVEEALFSPIAVGESSIAQDDQVEIDPVISDDLTGVVSANDPDLGESPTLDIIAGNNDADGDGTEAVAIQSFADGGAEIVVTDPDDVRENFRLTVEVSDRGGDTNEATVVIPVNGEGNQAPIAENATLNIVENSSGGTVVGTFPHTDPDFNNLLSQEDLTFSINQGNTDVDGDGLSAFRIDRFSGEILVADQDDLNFESADNRSFELEVVVTDLEGATDTAEVTVNLEDVNEAPVINNRFLERVTLNPITNPTEAADGDIVGAIAASDPDGTALSYEILSGNDPEENLADAFAINSDGEVSIANIEEIPDSGFFPLTVAISDETGLTTRTELVIPLGTQAPTIAADQSFTIPEDAAFETVVGTVSATEPDEEEISYFLASSQQEGLPAFEIDRATGEIVVTAPNALDFETQSTVELTVIARDPQQAIGVETVTVNLENVNEAPTFDENSTSFAIPASSQAGRGVGVVAAFDEDGDTVSYAIVGGNDDRDGDDTNPFTINAETGEVTVADADDLLTLEDNPFRLQVQARDGELNNTAEVDITALPAAPVIPNNGATFPINATSFAGALVDTVEAFDPDEGELSFAFSAGNEDRDGDENNPFRINTETGAIIVTDADDVADIEGNPFELSVLVTDEDGDTTTGNFTVTSGTGTVSTSDGISFSTPLPDQSEAELEQDLNDDGDTEDTVTPEPSNLVRPAIGSTEILSIENTGNAPLLISDVVVSEGLRDRVTTDFEALVEAATPVDDNGEALFDLPGVEIPVGANLELAVTYTPNAGGEVIDEAAGLTLFSNDPENGELNVALSGESTFNSDIDYNGSVGFPDVTLADSLFNTSSEELNPALNIDGEGGFGFSDLATLNQEFGASIA